MTQAAYESVKVLPIFIPEPGMTCLNLGCSKHAEAGYINVDLVAHPGVDQIADLEKPWPWPENSVDHIMANDISEHLRGCWEESDPGLLDAALEASKLDHPKEAIALVVAALRRPVRHYGVLHFMNEANRVLKPGGTLDVWVPSTDGRGWAQDPTHVSFWNENSFLYFLKSPLRESLEREIKGTWRPLTISTSPADDLGVRWVRAILEKEA